MKRMTPHNDLHSLLFFYLKESHFTRPTNNLTQKLHIKYNLLPLSFQLKLSPNTMIASAIYDIFYKAMFLIEQRHFTKSSTECECACRHELSKPPSDKHFK